jgi:hypothetical protein
MEYAKLVSHINLVSDEDFEFKEVLAFINDAIAKINVEVGAVFPFIDVEFDLPVDEYPLDAINETWQRMLFVPYAAGRIKENDSSQFEYTDWYTQFDLNLQKFKSGVVIPDKYVDTSLSGGMFEGVWKDNIFSSLKGW